MSNRTIRKNLQMSSPGPRDKAAKSRTLTACLMILSMFLGTFSSVQARPYSAGQDHTRSHEYYDYSRKPVIQEKKEDRVVLQGFVNYRVPKGTPIKLKLSMVPTNGLRLLDRDMDGNLLPAKQGQVITAKTTEDIFVGSNKVIPEGTTFFGKVSKIYPQRRVGRPGHLDISFTHLELPSGKQFAFKAEADNFKKSTAKTKLKGFGIIAAHAAGGAIVGAIAAYYVTGMRITVETYGLNIAGGAAAGALLATGFAIMRKGPKAALEPGDDLNLRINTDLLMPIAQSPTISKAPPAVDGLKIKVRKMKKKGDGLGRKILYLDLNIQNLSSNHFKSIDLFAEDSNGNRNPLSSGGSFEEAISFTVEPHSLTRRKVCFTLEWPKLPHKLVWLDHHTRQPIHVQQLY